MAAAVVRSIHDEGRLSVLVRQELLDKAQQLVVERELRSAGCTFGQDGKQTSVGERPDRLQSLLEGFKARPAPRSTSPEDVDEFSAVVLHESKLLDCAGLPRRLDREPNLGVKLKCCRHPVLAIQPAAERKPAAEVLGPEINWENQGSPQPPNILAAGVITEGKTKREAMRSLKRHLSRHLYNQLAKTPLTT